MFFGMGGNAQEVPISKAAVLAESLFDKKISTLYSRASKLSEQIDRSTKEFIDACDKFDGLSSDPDLEDLYYASASHVKNQKTVYITALKRILSSNNSNKDSQGLPTISKNMRSEIEIRAASSLSRSTRSCFP